MPANVAKAQGEFSLSEARRAVKHLFSPNAYIYWADFLVSLGIGVFCFQMVRGGTMFEPHQGFTGTPSQAFFFIVSCLMFYRAGMFIHELIHQRNRALPVFRIVWNLLCGIPFLMPTFVYYTHIDHHRRAHYGTKRDGEYLPFLYRGPWYLLYFLSWSFVIPAIAVLRFTVFSPIAWFSPQFRQWVHQHCSSLVMDPSYIRPLPTKKTLRIIRLQEVACFLWCMGIVVIPPLTLGRWAVPFAVQAYLIGVCLVMLNAIRTLGAHRWTNAGAEMTFVEQLLDSVNYPHNPVVGEMWGPVGTRYHALHHLFPSMPYHALPAAHRELMRKLPADSPYRTVSDTSLTANLIRLWRTVRSKRKKDASQPIRMGSA